MGFCYLMSKERAERVAAALSCRYPKLASTIDADLVRMYCVSAAEASEAIDGRPGTPIWFESMPPTVIAGRIDIKKLFATGMAEIR
jgi:hypothetical protein